MLSTLFARRERERRRARLWLGSPGADRPPKVALVTNFLPHYRKPLALLLQARTDCDIIEFSDGREWYWQRAVGPVPEGLRTTRPKGFWVGRTRFVPRLPLLLVRGRYDVIIKCMNGKFALVVSFLAAQATGAKFVLWTEMHVHPDDRAAVVTRPLCKALYRRADAILTCGSHVSDYVVANGADPAKVLVAPQVSDFAELNVTPPADPDRRSGLLYVGRLAQWKGPDVLLRAFATAGPEVGDLLVAGDGDMRRPLEGLADELGIASRVRFLGHVDRGRLVELYAQSLAVVIPSRRTTAFAEPWSFVANEAMTLGCPVIATDVVGAVQAGLVAHRITGLVVPADDPARLAAAIDAVTRDPERARLLAAEGRTAVEEFTYEAAVDAFVRAIELVVS